MIHLLLIVVFLSLTQISFKTTNVFWEEKLFESFCDDRRLPHILWLTKLRKNLTWSRYIINVPKCSFKSLSKALTSILILIFQQIKARSDRCAIFSDVKIFLTVLKNHSVIDTIKKNILRKKRHFQSLLLSFIFFILI